jgi:hypothetical protein
MPRKAQAGSAKTKDVPPSVDRVRRLLGPAAAAWDAFLDPARKRAVEWKRYRPQDPWSARVSEGKRTVLWLVPEEGRLRVAAILGEKAVARGLAGSLPQRLKRDLREAPAYPEGRVVRLRMMSAARVRDVERLIDLKVGRAE